MGKISIDLDHKLKHDRFIGIAALKKTVIATGCDGHTQDFGWIGLGQLAGLLLLFIGTPEVKHQIQLQAAQ